MNQKKTLITLGTKNKDKLRELQKLLKGVSIRVRSLVDFPKHRDVMENGKTFEANARKKARLYSRHTKGLVLADDSGLMVSSLKGKPGVYSARFAGPDCTYHDNNRKLLRLLSRVPKTKRRAKFVCVMALYDNGRFVNTVRGECRGTIAFEEKGGNGFGYDPVFIPDGFSKTFAELSPRVKNKISHRGKALKKAVRLFRISVVSASR
ncbi:MAG TPA: RdgB/HAM1 family non-canonical purine NTP pyrophosphatase [Candidatus Norongarragalinales archaeon]|nr:RdgB/HAM1 family non-canonical purine NTP pyrophosphatase [Candidatus Norongarragalinales archaeon]